MKKTIRIYTYLLFSLALIVFFKIDVYADTTGTVVVDDYLNVRNDVDGDSIARLTNGIVIDILETNLGSTNSCNAWYKIKYGSDNSIGYACGDYITLLKGYASCVENRDPVNIWRDVNKSGKVSSVTCDKEMTILDKDISSNNKCANNWYKVKYGNYTGYACSTYVYTNKKVEVTTSYNRPWTSPMKAIIGGAEFIGENYIAKGQHTSYLKKFNVNPNSSYNTYNHQYMANLAAPSSEARTSYNSYKDNNLLSLPLHFVIPTYNNMPNTTSLPGSEPNTSGESTIKDYEFEAKLNTEGFSETYKQKLRLLHSKYPNWTFENLETELDFNNAVAAEQAVSSINTGTKYYYVNSNGSYVSTEPGWYLANTATVSYYLDPRNFLTEQGILMFESLKYSTNYNETVVQSVLNGTFMQNSSSIDKLSYAKIFVEAGKSKDISPVYLASLARQESGVNGSLATSGQQFTYKNISYIGLYNFFNIGAYSSEESPIKAGLVWASGGDECTFVGNSCSDNSNKENDEDTTEKKEESIDKDTETNQDNNSSNNNTENESQKPTEKEETSDKENNTTTQVANKGTNHFVSNLGVKNNNGYINGLTPGTTAATITNKLKDAQQVSIVNAAGKGISGNTKLGTGSVVTVTDKDGKTKYSYTVVIYGDVNGDGNVTASDYVVIKNYILGKTKLSIAAAKGADSNKNGSVTASDYVVIKNYILGKINISQA